LDPGDKGPDRIVSSGSGKPIDNSTLPIDGIRVRIWAVPCRGTILSGSCSSNSTLLSSPFTRFSTMIWIEMSSPPKLLEGITRWSRWSSTFSGSPHRFARKNREARGRTRAETCQSCRKSPRTSRTEASEKYRLAFLVNKKGRDHFVLGTGTAFNISSITRLGLTPLTHDSAFMIILWTRAGSATTFTSSGMT